MALVKSCLLLLDHLLFKIFRVSKWGSVSPPPVLEPLLLEAQDLDDDLHKSLGSLPDSELGGKGVWSHALEGYDKVE